MKKSVLDCNKRSYTYKEALQILKKIQHSPKYELRSKNGKGEKTIYECPICRTWHLSSMKIKKFIEHKKVLQKRRNNRIERESDYWKTKLGIKDE